MCQHRAHWTHRHCGKADFQIVRLYKVGASKPALQKWLLDRAPRSASRSLQRCKAEDSSRSDSKRPEGSSPSALKLFQTASIFSDTHDSCVCSIFMHPARPLVGECRSHTWSSSWTSRQHNRKTQVPVKFKRTESRGTVVVLVVLDSSVVEVAKALRSQKCT